MAKWTDAVDLRASDPVGNAFEVSNCEQRLRIETFDSVTIVDKSQLNVEACWMLETFDALLSTNSALDCKKMPGQVLVRTEHDFRSRDQVT